MDRDNRRLTSIARGGPALYQSYYSLPARQPYGSMLMIRTASPQRTGGSRLNLTSRCESGHFNFGIGGQESNGRGRLFFFKRAPFTHPTRQLLCLMLKGTQRKFKAVGLNDVVALIRPIEVGNRHQHQRNQKAQHDDLEHMEPEARNTKKAACSNRNDAACDQDRPQNSRQLLPAVHQSNAAALRKNAQLFQKLITRSSPRLSSPGYL